MSQKWSEWKVLLSNRNIVQWVSRSLWLGEASKMLKIMTTATTLINFIKSNNPVWLLSSNLISSWSTNNLHFKTIKQLLKILVFLLCCGMNSISLFYCILSRFTKFWVNFWQHGESLTALTQITMSIKIKLPQCLKIDFKDNVSMFSMSLDFRW